MSRLSSERKGAGGYKIFSLFFFQSAAKGTKINAVREESAQYGEYAGSNKLEWEIFSDM
jgi:hypothetical protein